MSFLNNALVIADEHQYFHKGTTCTFYTTHLYKFDMSDHLNNKHFDKHILQSDVPSDKLVYHT